MDQKENLIDKDLSLVVVLPGGVEKMTTVHGSKPLIDLLVMLCAKNHLNPSSHTLELVTANRNHIKFKPNALIGALDAEKIILKPKGSEDKNKRMGPQMPEATVRMVINYKKTQKTILRVNPRVPLAELLPAICEKCEFDMDATVLLRDVQSLAPLDLSCSLNDYAIRELYARDTRVHPASPVFPPSPTHSGPVSPGKDKTQKEKENKGLFRMFRKSKKSQQAKTASAPASPVLVSKPRPLSMALPSSNSSSLFSTGSLDMPKKRRAPQPPILVSQGQTSAVRTRQRLYSEPIVHLHSDLLPTLSGGFSADSSLKRTKRRAPPPPMSPTVVVQEKVPTDETLQAGAAANTLEEISEQEETTASVLSTALSETQGEDGSRNMSTVVSMHSKSPDAEMLSTISAKGNEEEQSCELSSDGNQRDNTVTDSEMHNVVSTAGGTESSTLGNTGSGPCQVENVCKQPICEESTLESIDKDGSSAYSPPQSVPQPVKQDTEAQTSVHANTETPGEGTERLEIPVATSTARPTGEDAEVQTDFTLLPVPLQQHTDNVSSSLTAPGFESAGKKDMSTLTEELNPPDLKVALPNTSETSLCQDATPHAPPSTKMTSAYATDSEPKPKPSNELTRDYIPKAGMTTYTIVPPKSLEKLRYFEVALTLEPPAAPSEKGLDISSLHLDDCNAPSGQPKQKQMHSAVPREDLVMSNSTVATRDSVNGRLPDHVNSLSPTRMDVDTSTTRESHAGSPPLVREIKIPPATKPKPGSFRLPQPKKTPGYYVTSAAEKRVCASSGAGQKEVQGNLERAKLPPPPVQCHEGLTGATNVMLSPKDDQHVPTMRVTRQSSLSSRQPGSGLSLEKFRSFAGPRPFSPATPSRFAQAVSSAVKRSQSLSHGPKSPHSPESPTFSPITGHSSGKESQRLSQFKDSANTEVLGNKGSTVQEAIDDPSLGEILQMEGENVP